MDIKKLDDNLSVTGQVLPGQAAEVKAAGFAALICNRPDGESPDQPPFSEVAEAAKAAGLETRYIPLKGTDAPETQGAAFAAAMGELPKPVLAFCRTGNRSSKLAALMPKAGG